MLWHTCDLFLSPIKKIVCRTETNTIFTVFENSVSYSVSVERNRQILATGHTDRYVCYRRTLFSFSVLRGVWRCLFYLKGGRGALFSVWKMKEI